MSHAIFRTLLQQFCEIAQLAEPEKLYETGQLVIDQFNVDLSYSEERDPHLLHIHIDLGAIAEKRERDVYRALLEINLLSSEFDAAVIGIDSGNGHAVFSVCMPLSLDTTGRALVDKLNHSIDQAQFLREEVIAKRSAASAMRPGSYLQI